MRMTEQEAYAAQRALRAAGASDVTVRTHDRAVDDSGRPWTSESVGRGSVVTDYSVRVVRQDARHGNMVLRTVEAVPTPAEAQAIVRSMVAEARAKAKLVRARYRVEADLDRS